MCRNPKRTEMGKTNTDQIQEDQRIDGGIRRGNEIEIFINNHRVRAYEGETVGAVLAAIGIRQVRHTQQLKDPRGLYCCMGSCYGCLVTVDGRTNERACITPVQAGQQITLQEGYGKPDPASPAPPEGRLVRREFPLVVIGGGPAGLSAAIAAAKSGTKVLVIDENHQAGGQIYRQLPEKFQTIDPLKHGADSVDGRSLLRQADALSDMITIWNNALVWSVFEPKQLAIGHENELVLLDAKVIIVATGAYERPFPVPGWTLPGVMTAGGAQMLLKSQRIRPGRRVLLAGTGPLQLVVANQMLDAGMDVVAVAECNPTAGAWRFLPDLVQQPGLLLQGLRYIFRLKRAGVQILQSYVLREILGNNEVQRAVVANVDARCRSISGNTKTFDVDSVCIGYGLIPTTWATGMLGCKHVYDPMIGGWVPQFDENMQTDQAGIFVAGDGAGIVGVLAAKMEGTLAGLYASVQAGAISEEKAEQEALPVQKQLAAMGRFQGAIDRMYRIHPDLYAGIDDDTIVCRCEGITAGKIRKAIREGTMNLNDLKKRARSGMGYCQGTHCLPTITAMLARELGARQDEIELMTIRPPARPIPLSLLALDMKTDK